MLAKVIRNRGPRKNARRDFARRVRYSCAKACEVALCNLAGLWPDAALQMEVAARLRKRVRRPCYHVVLSWARGENPSDREVVAAAHRAMAELGARGHQYVIAVHRDSDNIHVHIVLNRVHPLTGKALSLSHDHARLERACRVIEHAFGWPADRGRFQPEVVDGEIRLVPMPPEHWAAKRALRAHGVRPDPRAVRGAERNSGRMPLRDRLGEDMLRKARHVITGATSWLALHGGLIGLGLRYIRHGRGARIEEAVTQETMPACHLGTAFGLHHLEARLGPFMAGPSVASDALDARAQARRDYRDARNRRRDTLSRLASAQQAERKHLAQAVTGLPRWVAHTLRSVLRQDHQKARAQILAEIPLPRVRDHGLTLAQGNVTPPACDTAPWRYSLRAAQAQIAGNLVLAVPPDHTLLWQAWTLSALSGQRENLGKEDTQRRTPDGQLLIARRNGAGSIVGFDKLMEVDGRSVAWTVSGADLGLARLGPADAETCVITPDALSGSVLAGRFPEKLIVIAAPTLSRWTERQLLALAKDRNVEVLSTGTPSSQPLLDQLKALLPRIKIFADASEEAAEDVSAGVTALRDPETEDFATRNDDFAGLSP